MKQDIRTRLHVINLSGHSQIGNYPPLPATNIQVHVAGTSKSARIIRNPRRLQIHSQGTYSEFTVPELADYGLVVLEGRRLR